MRTVSALACAGVLLLQGCASAPSAAGGGRTMVSTQLYLGLSKPGGGRVTAEEFDAFLRGYVTERFPEGLTLVTAHGQWRDTDSRVVIAEDTRVLFLVHDGGPEAQRRMREIVEEYKRRFAQQAVLRVDGAVHVSF